MKRNVSLEEISDGRLYGPNDMVKADCHGCKGCHKCCTGMGHSVLLDPYDVYRMQRGLGKGLAQLLADNGADIIIGSHPHVLQGVEMLNVVDANQNTRQVPVFYSLGNFISAQNRPDTMLGGLVKMQINYDVYDKSISFPQIGVVPLVTDYTASYKNITVYPLCEYTAEQARAHGVHRSYSNFSPEYLQKLFAERIPQEFQIW